MPTKLTTEVLNAAVLGFEEQKRRIDEQIAEIRQTLGGGPKTNAATPEATGPKRKVSAAARRRMAAAQRRRWAAIKAQSQPAQSGVGKTPAKKAAAKKAGIKKASVKAHAKAARKTARRRSPNRAVRPAESVVAATFS